MNILLLMKWNDRSEMVNLYFHTAIILILCRPLNLLNIFTKYFNYFLIYHDVGFHSTHCTASDVIVGSCQWWKIQSTIVDIGRWKIEPHSPASTITYYNESEWKTAYHRSFNISSINLYRYLSSYLFLVPFRLVCFFLLIFLHNECVCVCASCTFQYAQERWRQWNRYKSQWKKKSKKKIGASRC